ncbi:hypothetical protein C0Q70_20706 [Pomacea canaliculata]|uniref:Uncharacterized protein n=1 Tax=Pomacea canaliculata TaxID=400727 RepID=A0A2T7NGB9_POMCA|nr:hypothetical protein C0Q70_20706 [Pomacea canaliculata]
MFTNVRVTIRPQFSGDSFLFRTNFPHSETYLSVLSRVSSRDSAFSGTELTLQDDDESPLLMQQRPEDEDEEEDEQVILYEDEGEGEGAEEPVAEPVREFPTKTGGDKKKKKRKRKKLHHLVGSFLTRS